MSEKVSVVGLGKLGLGLALCFADAEIETLGVDVSETVLNDLNTGKSPVTEPQYDDLIRRVGPTFKTSHRHADAINQTDVTFILVATPSVGDGRFSNRNVISALESLAKAFGKSKKHYHLFVISSTVVPGSTEQTFIPLIERHSGRKFRQEFDVCFDPDFVALGTVIRDFQFPDLVIIGESSKAAGDRVEALHKKICKNDPPIHRMSLISAEVAKVSLNAYITMKISFANSVANLCERIPGADVDAITGSIGEDRRISPHYLRGGLAFGGTCFPRDTKAFMTICRDLGIEPVLISAVEDVNNEQKRHLSEVVLSKLGPDRKVSILGLAFKDKTPVIEASPAIDLIKELVSNDVYVTVYDPLAMESVRSVFDEEIDYAASIEDCFRSARVCVVTLMSENYKNSIETFTPADGLTIIDCWRQLDVSRLDKKIKAVFIGRAPESTKPDSRSQAV